MLFSVLQRIIFPAISFLYCKQHARLAERHKGGTHMKKIFITLLIALLVLAHHWNTYAEEQQICLNCGAAVASNFCPDCGHSNTASLPAPASDETYLSLKISYEKNAFLAKYDVDIYLDNVSLGTIKQSEILQKLIVVKKGIHELTLHKGSSQVASILISAADNAQLSCTLKAHLFRLEVKDLVNSHPVSETVKDNYELAKFASECQAIDRERFCRYPEKYANQKVHLQGHVVAAAENFAGAMKVVLKDGKNELWIVEYHRSKDEPRLLVNDHVDVFGQCKGITDYTSATESIPNLPTITLSYLKLK